MKKIEKFVNVYPVTKTLKFKLIPVGKTKENFDKNKLLEIDKERAENYKKAKVIIDSFYNEFINNCLNNFTFQGKPDNLKAYYKLINSKTDDIEKKKKDQSRLEMILRKEIVSAFEKEKAVFNKLFNKELFEEILNDTRISDEDKSVIATYDKFTTYFTGYFTNRKNLFSYEDKVGSISYRLINENLKTHIYNIKVYDKIKTSISQDLKTINKDFKKALGKLSIEDVFSIDYYNYCLTGEDINKYNAFIGGFAEDEKTKIKGLNEYINLFNQNNKESKLPKLKPLYKQILSKDVSNSFRFDVVEKDEEVFDLLGDIIAIIKNKDNDLINIIDNTFNELRNSKIDDERIFINSKKFNELSQKCFSNYSLIEIAIENDYDKSHKKGKNHDKYEKDKQKYIKNIKYLSIGKIKKLLNNIDGIDAAINDKIEQVICDEVDAIVKELKIAITTINDLDNSKPITNNKEYIIAIKSFLDSVLKFYKIKNDFCNYDDSEDIDLLFYSNILQLDLLSGIISIYNKIRNYVTKKPYKLDKIKLNFNCPTLLDGWDVNKETSNLGVILLKDNDYYLAIMNKNNNKVFENYDEVKSGGCYRKVNYKLLPGPNKMLPKVFLSKKGIEDYKPSKDLIKSYEKETHKKGDTFNRNDMVKLISFFKDSINIHPDFSKFNFKFSGNDAYEDISMFYKEVADQGYKITFTDVNENYINNLIEEGKLYLFRIYNKDFSKYSKGVKNLHTLYFEELFDNDNLKNIVYKLNGEAELFYREKSLEYKATHAKNNPIKNKNKDNHKSESVFKYDIAKDKRFTNDQFEFHVPITINFKADDSLFNDSVNQTIADCSDNYVIGIDRGERNLIYISVVSEKKGLVEQFSLNSIINEYNGNNYTTDYHNLLDTKEKERDEAKKSWTSISNIKELKEGYVSQVVHKICELVEKYDAVIVMEDLNSGFKNTRKKVDKQVYQKFEKMLIDKLNLYINKKTDKNKNGGLLKAYQLTRPYQGNKYMSFQNGFIYYVAPWNTSKIDPTTGFVNLFRLNKYTSVEMRKEFLNSFDSIIYNEKENVFEFSFNYHNFDFGSTDYVSKWTISSYGKRILTFRNSDKNSSWDNKEVSPTNELITLFSDYNIDFKTEDIKQAIKNIDKKDFFDRLFNIIKLILQMRNSITNSDVDYMISPVKSKKGIHYESELAKKNGLNLPIDADANGAYNIARKGLMIVERIKEGKKDKVTVINNKEWLEYAQTHLPI